MRFSDAFRQLLARFQQNDRGLTHLDFTQGQVRTVDDEPVSEEETAFLEESLSQAHTLKHLSIQIEEIDCDIDDVLRKYIRTSSTLKILDLVSDAEEDDEEEEEHERSTFILEGLLRAASWSTSLETLRIKGYLPFRGSILERCLANTRSLRSFEVEKCAFWSPDQASSLAAGFRLNGTLQKVALCASDSGMLPRLFFDTVLPSLDSHSTVKKLSIRTQNAENITSLQGLLETNGVLEYLEVEFHGDVRHAAITPILEGLKKNSSLKKLRIAGWFDLFADARTWTEMLQLNHSLQELDLCDCWLSTEQLAAIASGVHDNMGLKRLETGIQRSERGDTMNAGDWTRALTKNLVLEMLDLSWSGFSDRNIHIVADGLSGNRALQDLNLRSNAITSIGVQILATAMLSNTMLLVLDLSSNPIGGLEITCNSLKNLLVHGKSLEKLYLSCCQLGNSEAAVIADFLLQNDTLEVLDLSGNGIEGGGGARIFQGLYSNSWLRELNLSGNRILTDDSAVAAKEMLEQNTGLHRLILGGRNEMSETGRSLFYKGLGKNNALRFLRIVVRDDEEVACLAQALEENSILEEVELFRFFDPLSAKSVRMFFRHLSKMRGLQKLHLTIPTEPDDDCFKISDDTADILLESLRSNAVFHSVNLDLSKVSADNCALINFYLGLNRRGRRLLNPSSNGNADASDADNSRVPHGLWAPILANLASAADPSALFYFLRHKPDLFQPAREERNEDQMPVAARESQALSIVASERTKQSSEDLEPPLKRLKGDS